MKNLLKMNLSKLLWNSATGPSRAEGLLRFPLQKWGKQKLGYGRRSSWFCAEMARVDPQPHHRKQKKVDTGLTVPATNLDFSSFLKYSSTYLAAPGLSCSMRVLSSHCCTGFLAVVLQA